MVLHCRVRMALTDDCVCDSLFASPAGGAIISHSGYRSMQGFAAAVMGVVALLTVYIRYRVGGMDLRKKI